MKWKMTVCGMWSSVKLWEIFSISYTSNTSLSAFGTLMMRILMEILAVLYGEIMQLFCLHWRWRPASHENDDDDASTPGARFCSHIFSRLSHQFGHRSMQDKKIDQKANKMYSPLWSFRLGRRTSCLLHGFQKARMCCGVFITTELMWHLN